MVGFPFLFYMRKIVVIAVVVLVVAFAGYKLFFSPKITYQEASVVKKDLPVYISSSGKVRAVNEQEASFPILGQVEMIASSSTAFKKGEIVARLKTADLYASLQGAYAALNKARSTFYYYSEVKGQTDATSGWKEDKVSKSLVNQADNNVAIAQDGVEAALFNLDAARAAYNKAFIKAPFNGVVGQTSIKAFETATPGQQVMVLVDPTSFYFESEVDEVDIKAAQASKEAKIMLDSYPGEEFKGAVVSTDLTSHTTNSGGTAYYTKVTFTDVPPTISLRPGLNGEAQLLFQVVKDALVVPAAYVAQEDNRSYVLVKSESGSPKKLEVEIGEFVDGEYQITKGLSEGDTVLLLKK